MLFLGILMHQLLQNCPELIAEILKKLPLDTDPNFQKKQEFIALMCEKLGKLTKTRTFKII